LGETRDASCPPEPFVHGAINVVTRGDGREVERHAVFVGATDLMILSAALAQFIVNAGKRVRDEPERAEVIRAREMMDRVDDELYMLLHVKGPLLTPSREYASANTLSRLNHLQFAG
jgi:hypothetical protein